MNWTNNDGGLDGKKILFLQHNLLNGGPESVGREIVNGLKGLGLDIDLLLVKNDCDNRNVLDGINIKWLLSKDERVRDNLLKTTVRFIRIAYNYDVLVAGIEEIPTFLVALAGFFLRKKTVACIHINLTNFFSATGYSRLRRILMRLSFCAIDRVVCVSEGVRRDLERSFGVSGSAVSMIYNTVHSDALSRAAAEDIPEEDMAAFNRPAIISAGRLEYQKGFDELIRAFKRVLDNGHDVNLIILGDGTERSKLIGLAKELDVSQRVFLLGHKINPYKYMARARIFVLSSRFEGFAMVLLEALALGLPIVATDCPDGPAELLEDGKYGLMVPVDDPGQMADAVVSLLMDESLCRHLSHMGLQRVGAFDRANAVKNYYEVLAGLYG